MSVYLWRLLNQLRDINAENKVTLPRLTILRRMLEAVASLISAVRLQFVWKVFVSYFLFFIFRSVFFVLYFSVCLPSCVDRIHLFVRSHNISCQFRRNYARLSQCRRAERTFKEAIN